MLYLTDVHSWNWRIPGFDENKTQHRALFSTETKQVEPKISSRSF